MLFTASSAWAKDATIDGINYKIYSGYAIVGSNKTFAGPTVNIPDKIKYNLATLTFSTGTNIAIYDESFKGCGLTSLSIPSRVPVPL